MLNFFLDWIICKKTHCRFIIWNSEKTPIQRFIISSTTKCFVAILNPPYIEFAKTNCWSLIYNSKKNPNTKSQSNNKEKQIKQNFTPSLMDLPHWIFKNQLGIRNLLSGIYLNSNFELNRSINISNHLFEYGKTN